MNRVIFIGAGGHCRVVMDAFERSSDDSVLLGILDSDPSLWHTHVAGTTVLGGDETLEALVAEGQCDAFVIALGAYNRLSLRRRLFDQCTATGLQPLTVTHPASVYSPSAEIADGCQLLAQSVVSPDARLCENVIVNTAAVVEHDCVVGCDTHIAPRACLAGGVVVGPETHIGMGAAVLENLTIGARSIIGAGAVVTRDVPDDTIVVGVPARPIQRRNL